MKPQASANNSSNSIPAAHGLRAAKTVCLDLAISDTTLWRWIKRGWIEVANISGKNYVRLESLAQFERRAAEGEFSQRPGGAARESQKARAKKCPTEAVAA